MADEKATPHQPVVDLHPRDGDSSNQTPGNLVPLTRETHRAVHDGTMTLAEGIRRTELESAT